MPDLWDQSSPTIRESGEETLIEFALSLKSKRTDMIVANGDDAAVVKAFGTHLTTSVDAQVEGVHFQKEWLSPSSCGRRAFKVAASDLMAMGLRTDHALLSLELPRDLSFKSYQDLMTGFTESCTEAGADLIGGNITRGTRISLHMTMIANPYHNSPIWTRSQALAGYQLWLSGPCGDAAAGLALLQAKQSITPNFQGLIEAWRDPKIHWQLLKKVEKGQEPIAAMDLSDGLILDAKRMAHASNCRFIFERESLPISANLEEAAQRLEINPLSWVLGGGESYQLLIATPPTPPSWVLEEGFIRVGTVESGAPEVQLLDKGQQVPLDSFHEGWDPF